MTFNIIPNVALGTGVILVITFACGGTEEVPCKNTATAEWYKRQWLNPSRFVKTWYPNS